MTQLRSLKIENFRGIRRGQLDDLTDVNILVGKNNCGKTTVIEAMCRFGSLGVPGAPAPRDVFGRTFEETWSAIRSSVAEKSSRHGHFPTLSKSKSKRAAFIARYNETDDLLVNIVGSIISIAGRKLVTYHVTADGTPTTRVSERLSDASLEGLTEPASELSESVDDITEVKKFRRKFQVFRPIDAFNIPVEQILWSPLLEERADRHLTDALNEVFGLQIQGMSLAADAGLVALQANRGIRLDVMGDGTRVAFRSWIVLASLSDTLLMMEEPECFQHPGSLERYAAVVCRLAQKRRVQLVISTHSGECVSAFLRAAKSSEAKAAVYHLGLDPEGIQTARRLDPEAVESLRETGVDVRYLDLYA